MKPDPVRLFAYYHLGLDEEYQYRFRNLHETARHFGASPEEVQRWLSQDGMDPETIRHVDFNLSKAHADAMELDLSGASVEERERFVSDAWERFRQSRDKTRRATPYDDVDYDDLWEQKKKR